MFSSFTITKKELAQRVDKIKAHSQKIIKKKSHYKIAHINATAHL